MSHQVELSDTTFTRLQKHATPLVDSIETVITRFTDFYEQEHPTEQVAKTTQPRRAEPSQFVPTSPRSLTHTKVLSIKLGGVQLQDRSWSGLLYEMIRRTKPRLRNGDDATRLIIVNFVNGKKIDEGYHFIPEVGLSVQGQNANSAWRCASHIAEQLGILVEVEFMWRMKKDAENPGVTARLVAGRNLDIKL